MHPLADTGRLIAGRYRLQAPIGRGAMGVVWRARDQLLDRDVAVKEVQIAVTLTDEERAHAYQRTLREAKTAARLNHPAVVTVYDVAEDEGRPWIVMQLVNAQSLDQVLATTGPLSPRRAAEVGRQLLSALSVAHTAGVMHRDVKPSNVLLGTDDRAVLTDFGIATFQDDPKLTQTGMVMGSPGFTAPERIRGEDASPASDLWSLGATLFAAVEGHGPFEKRGGAITTMSAIINEDAPEAPTAGPLGPVIAALLRREPADRPDAATAARMITDVLPMLADQTRRPAAGYEPTSLSASSRPKSPGVVQPRAVSAAETSMDLSAAGQTISREPAGLAPGRTGPGGQPTPEESAPTAPQQAGAGQGGAGQGGLPSGWSSGWPQGSSSSRPEGPPPDFSSWYDPSPRSGAAPQPGSGTAPWSEAQPGPAPERRQRSGLWWKIAIIVLAVVGAVAGATTVVLLHHNNAGGTPGRTSTSSPSPGASALDIIDAINMPSSGAIPSGYTTYSQPAAANEKAGFSLAAPTDWKTRTNVYQTYLTDPSAANVNLLVDLTPHTFPGDMLREARYIEAQSLPKFPGYQRVALTRLTIRGQPGAYWKFTWNDAGVRQEALDLLYVAPTSAGPQSYALYMTAPASMWSQMQPVFEEMMETWNPVA
jgi:eukaryotic-like serine/threonine-protein kinase